MIFDRTHQTNSHDFEFKQILSNRKEQRNDNYSDHDYYIMTNADSDVEPTSRCSN